jgi:hypothetical protein
MAIQPHCGPEICLSIAPVSCVKQPSAARAINNMGRCELGVWTGRRVTSVGNVNKRQARSTASPEPGTSNVLFRDQSSREAPLISRCDRCKGAETRRAEGEEVALLVSAHQSG